MSIRKRIYIYNMGIIIFDIICVALSIYFDNYLFLLILIFSSLYMEIIMLNITCPGCGKRIMGMKLIGIPKKCTNCGYDFTKDNKV